VFFVIHVCLKTMQLIKMGEEKQLGLKDRLMEAEKKHETYKDRVFLVNNLEQTLFNRFFEINRQLIQLQQLFLNAI
jgi:hypothetical protein